jgi:hypothetical protein
MTLKQKIYNHYQAVINDKIRVLQKTLDDLKESGKNETKSTAGDKHETALAMLQIEQANTRQQLKEMIAQKDTLQKINPTIIASIVLQGSLIKTNKGYLFMSVALGKAVVDGVAVIALSAQSPLGAKLMGLTVAGVATVNNNSYIVEGME